MIILPTDATDEQIKQLVIDWIAVVAQERYEEALAMLYQGNINPYGSERFYPGARFTPEILQLAIASYGSLDPELGHCYRAAPVTPLRFEVFSDYFRVERQAEPWEGLSSENYLAELRCDLPLTSTDPHEAFADDAISDLTLQMYVRWVPNGLALELSMIHCM